MKNKKLRLKIIISLVVVIIIAIIIAILFFFTDVFRTKKGAFFRYLKMTSSNLEILNTDEFKEYETLKETTPYIRNAEMIVKSSSNIANSNIMDKLKFTMTSKVNNSKEKANYNININSANTNLATMSFARDKNIYGFNSPLISSAYIGIKNEDLSKISSAIVGDMYVPDEIVKIKMDKLLEVSRVEKTHIDSYYDLLKLDSIDTAYSKSENNIEIAGNKYNTTKYTLSLSQKESADIQISLLTKLTQDSIMMDFLTSKFKLLNLDEKYTDINTINVAMREKIENLKLHSEQAEDIEISVSEYRQKNVQLTVKINDNSVFITHLKDGDNETLILGMNDKSLEIAKRDGKYVIKYSYVKDDIDKSIEINYKMEGTIAENNISNIMDITLVNGIKTITYSYKDNVNFTNDIGSIETFDENTMAILNNYKLEQIEPFIKQLKEKINQVYISKGASIGINLDPIFEYE